jgi:hypothetical protein
MAGGEHNGFQQHNSGYIVRREEIDGGFTRVYWSDGGHTDVCVTDSKHGPMNFQGHLDRRDEDD